MAESALCSLPRGALVCAAGSSTATHSRRSILPAIHPPPFTPTGSIRPVGIAVTRHSACARMHLAATSTSQRRARNHRRRYTSASMCSGPGSSPPERVRDMHDAWRQHEDGPCTFGHDKSCDTWSSSYIRSSCLVRQPDCECCTWMAGTMADMSVLLTSLAVFSP